VDLPHLSFKTPYYSAADLQALIYNAQLEAVHSSLSHDALVSKKKKSVSSEDGDEVSYVVLPGPDDGLHHSAESAESLAQRVKVLHGKWSEKMGNEGEKIEVGNYDGGTPIITARNVQAALENTRPSVSDLERRRYERIYSDFLKSRGDLVSSTLQRDGPRQTLA